MSKLKSAYRQNFSLIIAFTVLISAVLVVALFVSYRLTERYVESEFYSKKIEVLEKTIKPYNDFFQNKIPEITAYQGFLNRYSAVKYAASVFSDYGFVKAIDFYHFNLSTDPQTLSVVKAGNLSIALKSVYHFLPDDKTPGKVITQNHTVSALKSNDDFKSMALKLVDFIQDYDTSRVYASDQFFNVFYDVKPDKINYINIPRAEELRTYKGLLTDSRPSSKYQQDMMTFHLSPYGLDISNKHPELYQYINIRQIVYDPLESNEGDDLVTEIALPGSFSDYKLYFQSERSFITAEVFNQFLPIAAVVLVIYLFVLIIIWLIYRNLGINHKLYKLQYDFINNFTHEFKTPVSVIKIAGSNLKSDTELTERQRKHYGKILDEEADKLNELMNRLLSFTQLENKSINLKLETIYLNEFVEHYINTFKIKYPDFKLSFEVTGITHFKSDAVLLGSIFQNMLENAYKYSPPNRKAQHISVTAYKREVVFSFKDMGIGIPKRELENIFKKFYRIESQYNQNGSVGLGLAFCKELINFMNGDITVKSKLNEGSEFRITLPIIN